MGWRELLAFTYRFRNNDLNGSESGHKHREQNVPRPRRQMAIWLRGACLG